MKVRLKYNESFDFTVEWFADFELLASTVCFLFAMSLFAFVIIHQGHERKEINLCLAAFIDPPFEITFHGRILPRPYAQTVSRPVDFAIKQVG